MREVPKQPEAATTPVVAFTEPTSVAESEVPAEPEVPAEAEVPAAPVFAATELEMAAEPSPAEPAVAGPGASADPAVPVARPLRRGRATKVPNERPKRGDVATVRTKRINKRRSDDDAIGPGPDDGADVGGRADPEPDSDRDG